VNRNDPKPMTGEPGALGWRLVAGMERMTRDRIGDLALQNAQRNQALIDRGRSLAALRGAALGDGDHAVIVAAGPSVKRRDPVAQIRDSGYRGAVVATDSAIYTCLRNGVVPDLVVTLDPHATRIVRWFGDPKLDEEALGRDDYYRRQDMDDAFADEMRTNREILSLLDRHGAQMRIALSTSASQAVVERVIDSGMQVYWWNPMLDDPEMPDSVTRALIDLNGMPAVNAGGNVGAACWMMAHAVLGKTRVALTGMDFSYYDGTPYRSTQYYYEAVDLVGEENLDQVFIRVHNPHLDAWFFTDPAYMWYRQVFLEMAADADCGTYNCTEGGILFGEPIRFMPLASFLDTA